MDNVKADVTAITNALNECDHSDPKVQVLHDVMWRAVWRNRKLLGLSADELLNLDSTGTQTFGGGTGKTPPPETGGDV